MTSGGQSVSTAKPAYTQDAPLFAEGRAECTGKLVRWIPSSEVSPYPTGVRGIDVSYPNCGARLNGRTGFAVVGLNGGRPFSFNPCLRKQYGRYARSAASALYLNTGYERWYRGAVTPTCAAAAHHRGVAYAVGCSEAATSVRHLTQLGLTQPRVWWLDVEPSNAWSSNRAVNTSVLRGMKDYLTTFTNASTVGIYSMWPWWHEITTGWRTSAPEWIPSSRTACPLPFSAGPVWLAQAGSTGLDVDIACQQTQPRRP
jgi:hypothetical protein